MVGSTQKKVLAAAVDSEGAPANLKPKRKATKRNITMLTQSGKQEGHTQKPQKPQKVQLKRATQRKATKSNGSKNELECRQPAPDGLLFVPKEQEKIRTTLLAWYDQNHRVLPWRRNSCSSRPAGNTAEQPAPADLSAQKFAYMVWVSEVMCQQTQVATVCPYFNRWLERWPSINNLAAATQEEVNTMWAGLGYYRRARYLLDGAQYICQKLGGKFPESSKELLQIPGVGPYTAAAIASIAFNQTAAAVDGNVIRVVSRLRALQGDPRQLGAVHASLASQILDPSRPGDFNQAMMELGATVCKPSNPECSSCPLAHSCSAWQRWQGYLEAGGQPDMEDAPVVTRYPSKVAKAAKKEQELAVCVVELRQSGTDRPPASKKARKAAAAAGPPLAVAGGSHYLLCKRPEGGLLAGLWEFPAVPFEGEASQDARQKLLDAYLADTCRLDLEGGDPPMSIVTRQDLGSLPHIFSHIRWVLHVEKLVVEADIPTVLQRLEAVGSDGGPELKLVAQGDMVGQGLTSSVHKIFKMATSAPGGISGTSKEGKALPKSAGGKTGKGPVKPPGNTITKFFKTAGGTDA